MSGHRRICVLGSYVVDMSSLSSRLPETGESVIGSLFRMGPGGKGSNQGVAARRAGGDVVMITKVGKDVFGDMARRSFLTENLDSEYIFVDETAETGAALIMVDDKSANRIVVIPGASGQLTEGEIERARPVIEGAGILLTQLEINLSATRQAIGIAHAKGVCVILNTAPVRQVEDILMSQVDIVTPNEVEARVLTGTEIRTLADCRTAAEFFFRKGVHRVAITWGANGVYAHDGDQEAHIPAIPVNPVDTTGAGDAFNGGLAVGLAEGMSFFDAVRFGNVVAGLSVTRYGSTPAMPHRIEIDEYIARNHDFLTQRR
jgi:ribokinase